MAFDTILAGRIRDALARQPAIVEKKMFGGVCFLLHGHMLVGVWREFLIVRLGRDGAGQALRKPHVKIMDITGKPMAGWILVDPAGVEEDNQLTEWLNQAVKFIQTLPPK